MRSGFTLIIVLLFGSAQVQAADQAACREIADDAERLACYDGLERAPAPPVPPTASALATDPAPEVAPTAEAAPVAEVAPAPAAAAPPPVPEDLGAEMLPDKREEDKEQETFTATITRCGEMVDGRYLFYFDNGQVWKQANDKRLYFRDCQFDVTITKDFFGYKMQQVGEKKRIRIKRMR